MKPFRWFSAPRWKWVSPNVHTGNGRFVKTFPNGAMGVIRQNKADWSYMALTADHQILPRAGGFLTMRAAALACSRRLSVKSPKAPSHISPEVPPPDSSPGGARPEVGK